MFLVNLDFAAHPAVADRLVQQRNGFDNEAFDALAHEFLGEGQAQPVHVVGADELDERALFGGQRGQGRGLRGQLLEFDGREPHDLAGPVAAVHEAPDQAQPVDLIERVNAFAMRVAGRLREAVTALPDTQGVLRQAGVAFDGADADQGAGGG